MRLEAQTLMIDEKEEDLMKHRKNQPQRKVKVSADGKCAPQARLSDFFCFLRNSQR